MEYGSFPEDAGELVDVGASITLNCSKGFTMDGSAEHECLPDQTFGNVSMCIGEPLSYNTGIKTACKIMSLFVTLYSALIEPNLFIFCRLIMG